MKTKNEMDIKIFSKPLFKIVKHYKYNGIEEKKFKNIFEFLTYIFENKNEIINDYTKDNAYYIFYINFGKDGNICIPLDQNNILISTTSNGEVISTEMENNDDIIKKIYDDINERVSRGDKK